MRLIIPLIVLLLIGCKKSEDRSCIKSIGEQTEKEVSLDSFDKLFMGPHLRYVLVQDTVEKVVLKGGKNLLNLIETRVDEENRLNLLNNNTCNFLRDYSEVVIAEIHFKTLTGIRFEGTHEVDCPVPINADILTLMVRDGAGEVRLNLNVNQFWANVTYGWGNFKLSGDANYLNLNIDSNGFGDTYDLNVKDSLHVISKTTELIKVRPDGCVLKAQTHEAGDIWYVGSPTSIDYQAYGTGALIDKN